MTKTISFFFVCLALSLSVRAGGPDGNQLVKPSLIADTAAIEAGKPFTVAVRFAIEPNYHIYWINPGESGQPPEVKWKLPAGFVAGDLQWPTPHQIDLPGGIVNYGYEKEAVLIATITPPEKLDDTQYDIAADISWLVCDPNRCLPGQGAASLSLPVGNATAAHAEEFARWCALLPIEFNEKDVPATLGTAQAWAPPAAELTVHWNRPVSDVNWFIAVPEGYNLGDSKVEKKGDNSVLSTKISVFVGNTPQGAKVYTVVAYKNESGERRGFVYWLHVGHPPAEGGGGQSGR